jgi:hypothetical protein
MDIKMSNKNAYKIELLGFLVSIVFCTLAMIFYAGGTQMDPSAPGYSFWFNTISDSGRLIAHNGKPNLVSFIFLSIAWIVLGITWIPFFIVFPRLFEEGTREKKLAEKGGYLGIISSICHILVVLAPVDIFFVAHYLIAFTLYLALISTMILYNLSIKRSEKFSKEYKHAFMIFTGVFILYVILALISVGTGIRELMTIFQKIGRFSIYAGFTVLTIGAWKLE